MGWTVTHSQRRRLKPINEHCSILVISMLKCASFEDACLYWILSRHLERMSLCVVNKIVFVVRAILHVPDTMIRRLNKVPDRIEWLALISFAMQGQHA